MRLYVKLACFVAAFAGAQCWIEGGGLPTGVRWVLLDARAAWAQTWGTGADRDAAVAAYRTEIARENEEVSAAAGWGVAAARAEEE